MNALRHNIFYSTVFLHVLQVSIRYPNLPIEFFALTYDSLDSIRTAQNFNSGCLDTGSNAEFVT